MTNLPKTGFVEYISQPPFTMRKRKLRKAWSLLQGIIMVQKPWSWTNYGFSHIYVLTDFQVRRFVRSRVLAIIRFDSFDTKVSTHVSWQLFFPATAYLAMPLSSLFPLRLRLILHSPVPSPMLWGSHRQDDSNSAARELDRWPNGNIFCYDQNPS